MALMERELMIRYGVAVQSNYTTLYLALPLSDQVQHLHCICPHSQLVQLAGG